MNLNVVGFVSCIKVWLEQEESRKNLLYLSLLKYEFSLIGVKMVLDFRSSGRKYKLIDSRSES